MYIHKEGYPTILLVLAIILIYVVLRIWVFRVPIWADMLVGAALLFLLSISLWFFRMPARKLTMDEKAVICPADGEIVIIEKVFEPEYFNDERIQVSIFMSPLNVHVQRYPFSGVVTYSKYHPGKYLVAWHPKSSTLNERTSVVIQRADGSEVLVRQIAGAVARRIVCYAKEGEAVKQGDELGFIKFGSRVDLFLPLDFDVKLAVDQLVVGGVDAVGLFAVE